MQIFKNKIFLKTFFFLFVAVTTISAIFSFYFISKQKEEILESLHSQVSSIAKSITFVSSDALILNDNSFLLEFNSEFIKESKDLENIIISKLDKSYFIIKKQNWSYNKKIDEIYTKYEKKDEVSLIINSPILGKKVFHFVQPIVFSNINWGWLHISLNLDSYNKKIANMYWHFLVFAILLFLVSVLVSYVIAMSISYPIIKLNKTAKEISQGDYKVRSNYKSKDELGELTHTFNKMMGVIEESQSKLEKINDELEDRVDERTSKLNDANILLEQKTSELEELNKNLDVRVKHEVGKREEQENILIQQSRLAAIGEMIGNIAHQWRQPLSVITTAATGIKLEKELGIINDDKEVDKLDCIVDSANYLSKTIEDFRNFFNPNHELELFSIEKMVEHSLDLINASLRFGHIEIQKDFKEVGDIYGYANEFSQAVLNVITNSKDALIEKKIENPLIKISIYEKSNYCYVEVEDNAGGIDPQIMPKIFEPYFTTKHQSRGTGIGLYMSKMIIEQNMEGTLSFENGKDGAKFKFVLPIK